MAATVSATGLDDGFRSLGLVEVRCPSTLNHQLCYTIACLVGPGTRRAHVHLTRVLFYTGYRVPGTRV